MAGKAGFILTAAVAAALLLFAGATGAQIENPGEKIMMQRCQGCHDLRVIQTSAMDPAGWEQTVGVMIDQGATVAQEDVPVLVAYLPAQHGPIPDGAGKDIVLNTCTLCHDLKRIRLGRRSTEDWEETLISMLNEGAPLSDDAFPVVHAYLSRHFGLD